MAILSTCWLIIESIVIRDGFLRSSYLKLYMHPVVLFLCQLLIWLYLFFLWLLPCFQTLYNAFSSVLVTFSKLFTSFLQVIMVRREATCTIKSRKEIKNTLNNLELSRSIHNPIPAFSFSFKYQVDTQLKVLLALREGKLLEEEEEEEDDFFYEFDQEGVVELLDTEGEEEEEKDIDDDIDDAVNMENNLELEIQTTMPLDQEDEYSITSGEEEEDIVNSDVENYDLSSLVASDRDHPSPSSIASLDSACQDTVEIENQTHRVVEDDETDQVYKKYCERMRWYDILSRDRTYGLSVISNQMTASSLRSWGETAEKRLKQSIEKDLELVYVAQSCLSWEALQHQYITVKDSSKPAGGLHDIISREFQNFQVLLERFLEDERCQGKRVLSFVQRRFELMSFFQVPRLSGYNREGPHEAEEGSQDKQVLKAIERCIEVFYDFVKVDIMKPLIWERLKISLTNSPLMELEDPRDFKLFLDLKNSLQKEHLLKEIQQGNKKKIWFKKKSSNMEADKIEKDEHFMLVRFITIDLKLVSRVLHMSLVSSSHLKWCHHKLNNIHFNGDKISRTFSPTLFPSS
ncbi:PREDICTED: uncharacterized protein LOC104702134 isoform X2 [Camelina sativa]|uniref:Uncharacterized protein LOC104702134 isoform X2 n=1 Tax=Camelina sativa TaxID=90675 RepID=A0ABM0SWW3_CAMSA|nr:PREDICTED: uncharacterized protein LOC104702134 isoform X2 [Camelina sativa]